MLHTPSSPLRSIPRSIIIVGGGFAGAVTAIKLLDRSTEPLAITIIERRAELGRGVAYSTVDPQHLVNGAARIFSLHPDDPDHLVRWLMANGPEHGWTPPEDVPDSSPPRWLFGSYVLSELTRAIREADPRSSLRHIKASAVGMLTGPSGVCVGTSDSQQLLADEAVLATGVFQSQPSTTEAAVVGDPRYVANPWDSAALDRLAGSKELLLIGSSLSMVDVVASMEARGFKGGYRVVSRRGQIVEPRRNVEAWRDFLAGRPLPKTTRALLALVKAERRAIEPTGLDWQGLPLTIRPWILALWQGATDKERLKFARHLRAFWDVTAHRAAPPSFERVALARSQGRWTGRAGRVLALHPQANGIVAEIRWRDTGAVERLRFDGVVNCRGHQEHDWRRIADPFVQNLLENGIVRPHATGFGIDATHDCQVISRDGETHGNLFAIGHPLRGVAWESSSIGEQLAQAIALAGLLVGASPRLRALA
ncbi:FAD/NAD(P)-binding protein [Mesorhizobium sp. M0323]|uniref:FAD/NAD(P)-binding protein n=1 Tax=Mesorhizobium sp. M0323 TaxID=2956938 RepID=UPI003335634B